MGWRIVTPVALPLRDFCDDPTQYTWEDWHRDARTAHPVRYFAQFTLPRKARRFWSYPKQAWYWVRTHTYNRYHVVDMRCPGYGLDYHWGWLDRCEAVLVASFQLLREFVDHEAPELAGDGRPPRSYTDWDAPGPWCDAGKEISVLYRWWTKDRLAEHAAHDARWDNPKTPEERAAWLEEADALDRRDDEMLERLVRVRSFLWT